MASTPVKNIPIGSTLGMLGGGQLGRMFAQAAARLGYQVCIYAPEDPSIAADVAEDHIIGGYADKLSLEQFTRKVAAITYEFENVPSSVGDIIGGVRPIAPPLPVLHAAQNRLREKQFFVDTGVPVAPYREVTSEEDLLSACGEIGLPAILKTAESGYDGKGQRVIEGDTQIAGAWQELNCDSAALKTAILEKKISLAKEVSLVIARNASGEVATIGPVENVHKNQILFTSSYPSTLSDSQQKQIIKHTEAIAERSELTGVLCVEYFIDTDEKIYANEMAPRPHNSGHLSIEAHSISQFEMQVRALVGLPLPEPENLSAAAMINLLGDLWPDKNTPPDFSQVLRDPHAYLHLYGKKDALPGRKMGHITVLAETAELALQRAHQLFQSIQKT